jgi:hypothetical protein
MRGLPRIAEAGCGNRNGVTKSETPDLGNDLVGMKQGGDKDRLPRISDLVRADNRRAFQRFASEHGIVIHDRANFDLRQSGKSEELHSQLPRTPKV